MKTKSGGAQSPDTPQSGVDPQRAETRGGRARVRRKTAPAPEQVAALAESTPPDAVIGRGGMGAVLRSEDRNIRRYFAKKVIDPELASDPEARARFLMEAQITGQLEHPHIVPVYDLHVSAEGEPTYFAMKLVEGVTLASLIRPSRVASRGDAELWDLLNVFLKVCDAVAYAHSRGVVHRDLKPDNVMIGPYGQVYVMDWGVARVACRSLLEDSAADKARPVCIDEDAALEVDGTILGTPLYMAPEQAWGRLNEIDARTDVFALGAILYHVLTGRAPYRDFRGAEIIQAARRGEIPPPSEVAGNVPLSPALCDIAMKAMRVARDDRYQSVPELKGAVERALRGGLWLGTRTFPAGTIILNEGDRSDGAYIITKGRCVAYRTERGEQRKLREMGAGDVFGEMALLSSRPRSASVLAVDDVTAIVVTRETLVREIPADSWLLPLLRTLVERFRELDEKTRR